jgi:hypothetical protein
MADAGARGPDQAAAPRGPRAPRRVPKPLTPAQAALRRQELGAKALDPEFVQRYVLYIRRHRWVREGVRVCVCTGECMCVGVCMWGGARERV